MPQALRVSELCEYKPRPGLQVRRQLGQVLELERHHARVQPVRRRGGGVVPVGEAVRVPLQQVRPTKADPPQLRRRLPEGGKLAGASPPGSLPRQQVTARLNGAPGPAQPRPPRPLRSRAYLAWLRSLSCCSCSAPPGVDPHHHGPRGVGQRTDDLRAVPLCRRCHDAWHGPGAALPGRTRAESVRLVLEVQVELLVRWTRERG